MYDCQLTLEVVDVASPCDAPWNSMRGDDVIRHCDQCKLNVYNLSGMSRIEAETLINQHEGRLCVRLLKRRDGTVLTHDCPIGLRAIRRRAARLVAAIAALTAFLTFGTIAARSAISESADELRPLGTGPLARLTEWLSPREYVVMGDMITNTTCPTTWEEDSSEVGQESNGEAPDGEVPVENADS